MTISMKQGTIFDAIMDAAVCGIMVIDKKGLIQHFNPAGAALFGYEINELVGRNVSLLMPEPDHSQHDSYITNYLRTGERKIIGSGRKVLGKRKDGKNFPMFLSVGHIDHIESSRFVGIIHDLTNEENQAKVVEKTRQEAELLRERLHHAGRISLLGEMATGIAHEINQPLAAIATYALACKRLLTSDGNNTEEVIEALGKIDEQARRASKVITSVRHLSKSKAVGSENCCCIDLISEMVQLAEGYAGDNQIRIRSDLENIPNDLIINVDPIQTQQVLLNLINNAIESMTVNIDSSPVNDEIWVRASTRDSKWVEVAVEDSGHGISKEDLNHIFDAFYTTKDSGLGIGLSICQSIVIAQGGEISAVPNSKQGTTFTITLPIAVDGSR